MVCHPTPLLKSWIHPCLDWIPDNCCQCRPVRRIFEQTVTYREWQEPLMYADDEPHTTWAWNPLSKNKH